MSEETFVAPVGGGMKNFGLYAHIAEISLILGSSIYFYSRNAKLEARIAELEQKLAALGKPQIESHEDKQREMNEMATFLYHKLKEELLSSTPTPNLSSGEHKKKKKERKEQPEEILVKTEENDSELENELKKEM